MCGRLSCWVLRGSVGYETGLRPVSVVAALSMSSMQGISCQAQQQRQHAALCCAGNEFFAHKLSPSLRVPSVRAFCADRVTTKLSIV